VAEVYASFKQLAHGKLGKSHAVISFSGFDPRQGIRVAPNRWTAPGFLPGTDRPCL